MSNSIIHYYSLIYNFIFIIFLRDLLIPIYDVMGFKKKKYT